MYINIIKGAIDMRTTVEITKKQRARLLEIAAHRGEKGFSRLVQEALDAYLRNQLQEERKRQRALKLCGSLTDQESDQLRKITEEIRDSWR
jgi:hypothetical protein